MGKSHVMTIRVPEELKERIETNALLQGVSINQFALYAFTKELAELENSSYFQDQLRGKKKEDILSAFDRVLSKVKPSPPPEWDALEAAENPE